MVSILITTFNSAQFIERCLDSAQRQSYRPLEIMVAADNHQGPIRAEGSWQRRRLRIRPGLTCLWALEGRSRLQFDRWVKLDLLYIDNWSVWLDFKILLKTIPTVLSSRGAH